MPCSASNEEWSLVLLMNPVLTSSGMLAGCAWKRKVGRAQVTTSLPQVKFVFEDEKDEWQHKSFADMSVDESTIAQAAWAHAEAEDIDEAKARDSGKSPGEADEKTMQDRMKMKLRDWKVSVRELHDAVVAAGLQVPARPSWLN